MPHEHYNLTSEDKFILSKLLVPIPSNEAKRIETLRQSKLLENDSNETGFNRFTSLASRLFDVRNLFFYLKYFFLILSLSLDALLLFEFC